MRRLIAFFRRFADQQQGYALVVVVLLFTAFAAAAVAYLDRNTVQQKIDRQAATRAELSRLSNAIVQYYYFNPTQYRYPCPAPYNVAVSNSAFGNESTGCQTGTPGGIDVLTGGEVIRGMVPVRALAPYGIDATEAFDAWGDRIMYVVNRQLTTGGSGTPTQYPNVKDINTNVTLAAPDFMLISYGPDRVGGIMKSQTSVGFSCSASTTREENCNGDLNFLTASANTPSTATASTYFDDIVSMTSHLSIPYQACANGATDPPACDTCSDGFTLSRTLSGACSTYYNSSGYTGTYTQAQTRPDCSTAWSNSGSPNVTGCTTTSCTNGASNYPTCTYAYTCSDTYCVNGTCTAPTTIQSNTDITGTTGSPNGSTGGDIYSCNGSTSGYCANSPNTCTAGTATGFANNYTGTNCGGSSTWTCSHVGSGSDANCSASNTPCTTCSTTAISGYDSGTGWHGPVQTPTYNVCSAGVTTGMVFEITTDSTGSSWHGEAHNWTFTQGVSQSLSYTPYDSKSKSTTVQAVYDGSCGVYATATFTRNNGSDYQWVRVQLTGINTCVAAGTLGGGGAGTVGGPVGCFLGSAKVLMADGSQKPIAKLKKGELVQGPKGVNRVIFLETHKSAETLYGLNGGKPFVTAEHMLMTTKGWRSIDPALAVKESHGKYHPDKLEVGDVLLLRDGKTLAVESIDPHDSGKMVTLYNPALNGDHMYYVNGIQVHNLKCDCGGDH